MVNRIAVTTFLLTFGLHRCWQRIFNNYTKIFFFKLVTFSKNYARKQKWMFLSEHSVYKNLSAGGRLERSAAPNFYFATRSISPKLMELGS